MARVNGMIIKNAFVVAGYTRDKARRKKKETKEGRGKGNKKKKEKGKKKVAKPIIAFVRGIPASTAWCPRRYLFTSALSSIKPLTGLLARITKFLCALLASPFVLR